MDLLSYNLCILRVKQSFWSVMSIISLWEDTDWAFIKEWAHKVLWVWDTVIKEWIYKLLYFKVLVSLFVLKYDTVEELRSEQSFRRSEFPFFRCLRALITGVRWLSSFRLLDQPLLPLYILVHELLLRNGDVVRKDLWVAFIELKDFRKSHCALLNCVMSFKEFC